MQAAATGRQTWSQLPKGCLKVDLMLFRSLLQSPDQRVPRYSHIYQPALASLSLVLQHIQVASMTGIAVYDSRRVAGACKAYILVGAMTDNIAHGSRTNPP